MTNTGTYFSNNLNLQQLVKHIFQSKKEKTLQWHTTLSYNAVKLCCRTAQCVVFLFQHSRAIRILSCIFNKPFVTRIELVDPDPTSSWISAILRYQWKKKTTLHYIAKESTTCGHVKETRICFVYILAIIETPESAHHTFQNKNQLISPCAGH